jgi:hypothetical protein
MAEPSGSTSKKAQAEPKLLGSGPTKLSDFSMLDQKDFTRFLELKRRTLELLALVSIGLTPAQKAEVEDDILNGELRLAAEFMVDFIADNDSSISPKTFHLIEDLMAELKSNRSYAYLKNLIAS